MFFNINPQVEDYQRLPLSLAFHNFWLPHLQNAHICIHICLLHTHCTKVCLALDQSHPLASGYHPASLHFIDYPISFLHLQTFSSTGCFPLRGKICSFSPVPASEYSPSPTEGVCLDSLPPFPLLLTTHPKRIWHLAHHCTFNCSYQRCRCLRLY